MESKGLTFHPTRKQLKCCCNAGTVILVIVTIDFNYNNGGGI